MRPIQRRCILILMAGAMHGVPALAGPLEDAEPRAVAVLLDASRGPAPQLRMHATEVVQAMPTRALPLVQLAMDDPNPAVRFAALVNVGRLKLDSLADTAEELAADPKEPDYVRAAAAFAADQNGRATDLTPMIQLLWNADPGQRANGAMLLGLSGKRSAIPMLRDVANDPMPRVRPVQRELLGLQVSEALLRLGSEDDLQVLRGAAYSNFDEVRVLAVLTLGRLGDGGMQGNFVTMLARDAVELRLAAAEALARLGSNEGLPVSLQAANRSPGPKFAAVRAQAAIALGQALRAGLPPDAPEELAVLLDDARGTLVRLLDDPDPTVRVAAAAAILEHLDR